MFTGKHPFMFRLIFHLVPHFVKLVNIVKVAFVLEYEKKLQGKQILDIILIQFSRNIFWIRFLQI